MAASFRLTMQQGPNPGKVFEIAKDVLTIGRDVSNDIVINDAEVSRHHTRLTRQGEGYAAEDLGSTNGTFVNGMRLTGSRPLSHGDVLALGETVLFGYESITVDAAATIAAAAPPPPPVMSQPQPAAPKPAPASTVPPPLEPVEAGNRRRFISLGCGCLTVLGCIILFAGAGYYIDSQNLYCDIVPFLFPGC